MSDAHWKRDIGPYETEEQAWMQFLNWSHGLPGSTAFKVQMLLQESLMLAGIEPTEFELSYLKESAIDPVLAQLISGLLLRARHGQPEGERGGQ